MLRKTTKAVDEICLIEIIFLKIEEGNCYLNIITDAESIFLFNQKIQYLTLKENNRSILKKIPATLCSWDYYLICSLI